jgi:Asp-tRNA(Asn)/Glu-tRNA(Gln) amidotransferase A subunit family amidase
MTRSELLDVAQTAGLELAEDRLPDLLLACDRYLRVIGRLAQLKGRLHPDEGESQRLPTIALLTELELTRAPVTGLCRETIERAGHEAHFRDASESAPAPSIEERLALLSAQGLTLVRRPTGEVDAGTPVTGAPPAQAFVVTDPFCVEGFPAASGLCPVAECQPQYTAWSVEMLQRSGTVLLAKCPGLPAGGSERDSPDATALMATAACRAVRSRSCEAALALDLLGETLAAAAEMGLWALGGGRGAVSRHGVVSSETTLGRVAIISGTPGSLRDIFNVCSQPCPQDGYSLLYHARVRRPQQLRSPGRVLRCAWWSGATTRGDDRHASYPCALESAQVEVEPVQMSYGPYLESACLAITCAEASSELAWVGREGGWGFDDEAYDDEVAAIRGKSLSFEALVRVLVGTYLSLSAEFEGCLHAAQRASVAVGREVVALLESGDFDALLAPFRLPQSGGGSGKGQDLWLSNHRGGLVAGLAGLPSLCLPDHRVKPGPTLLVGRDGEELALLETGRRLEELMDGQ